MVPTADSNGASAREFAPTETPVERPKDPIPSRASEKQATNPEGIAHLLEVVAEKVDPIVKLITTYTEGNLKRIESESNLHARMAWIAVTVVALIVLTAGTLTYLEKVDGATFTFLLGLIVGYILTFIKDSIQPSE